MNLNPDNIKNNPWEISLLKQKGKQRIFWKAEGKGTSNIKVSWGDFKKEPTVVFKDWPWVEKAANERLAQGFKILKITPNLQGNILNTESLDLCFKYAKDFFEVIMFGVFRYKKFLEKELLRDIQAISKRHRYPLTPLAFGLYFDVKTSLEELQSLLGESHGKVGDLLGRPLPALKNIVDVRPALQVLLQQKKIDEGVISSALVEDAEDLFYYLEDSYQLDEDFWKLTFLNMNTKLTTDYNALYHSFKTKGNLLGLDFLIELEKHIDPETFVSVFLKKDRKASNQILKKRGLEFIYFLKEQKKLL